MPIPIGTPKTPSIPTVKLRHPGDRVGIALVDEREVPWLEFGTGAPKLNAKGEPRTQVMVLGIVVGHSGATVTNDGADVDVQPGDLVRWYFSGRNRWDPDLDKTRRSGQPKSWGGAKDEHGQLMSGDVLTITYEGDVAGQGANPRKLRTANLRRAKPDEAAQTQRCEQLHREMTGVQIGASGHDNDTGWGNDTGWDEEPF